MKDYINLSTVNVVVGQYIISCFPDSVQAGDIVQTTEKGTNKLKDIKSVTEEIGNHKNNLFYTRESLLTHVIIFVYTIYARLHSCK